MNKIMRMVLDGPTQNTLMAEETHRFLFMLTVSFFLALFMMVIYRLLQDDVGYNHRFNITLMMLAILSTVLLSLIQQHPILSLGVIGSLSICRIRINTRDPRDLAFVFWSLSIGISCALGAFAAGVISSLFLGIVMLILGQRVSRGHFTLVIRGEPDSAWRVEDFFRNLAGSRVQAQHVTASSFELVYSLRGAHVRQEELLETVSGLEGVQSIHLLAPASEVR